jgi:hypothetical protein
VGLGRVLKAPFRKAKETAVQKLIEFVFGGIAAGRFGAGPKKVYWFLAGKKTYVGVALAAIAHLIGEAQAAGLCSAHGLDCEGWATGLQAVAAFLVTVGLLDAAHRAPAPKKLLLIAFLLFSPALASAAEPEPLHGEGRLKHGAWAWTQSVVTQGERQEFIGARLAGDYALTEQLHLVGRLDASRIQDGGTVVLSDPRTFRSVEVYAGAVYRFRPSFGLAAIAGTTYSIEGRDGPKDPRQATYAGGLAIGDASSGAHGFLMVGSHEPAGRGVRGIASIQVPFTEELSIVADGAFRPSDDFKNDAYMRAGIAVRTPWP